MKIRILLALFSVITFTPVYAHEEDPNVLLVELSSILENTKPNNCISALSYRNIVPLDKDNLLFMGTSRAWVNRLPLRCEGIHRRAKLTFDYASRRTCKGSIFSSNRSGQFTATCRLGKFYKIEKRIAERLRDAARKGEFD